MHCLHICNDFSSSRVHSQLYRHLDDDTLTQTIFHPVRKGTAIGNNTFDFKQANSKVLYSRQLHKAHRLLFRAKIRFLYQDIKANINLDTVDLVHATTLFSDGALALKIFQDRGIPYIVAVRSTDIGAFFRYRPDLLPLGAKILTHASKVIFISDSWEKKFFAHPFFNRRETKFKHKCEIIYNGINSQWLSNRRQKPDTTPFKILYAGKLLPRKNVALLMEAVLQLNQAHTACELTLIGNQGSQRAAIAEIAAKYPKYFTLVPTIQNTDELIERFREHHIFAMPSTGETFGLVYIEALSQGLPILFTQDDGVDGVFKEKVGVGCLPEVPAIIHGIKQLFENFSDLELHKLDFRLFDWTHIAAKYKRIYLESLEGSKTG